MVGFSVDSVEVVGFALLTKPLGMYLPGTVDSSRPVLCFVSRFSLTSRVSVDSLTRSIYWPVMSRFELNPRGGDKLLGVALN